MGFLFDPRMRDAIGRFHGLGTSGAPQLVEPSAAESNSVALDPGIVLGTATVIPTSAISTSVALTPIVQLTQLVIPATATSTSVALSPSVTFGAITIVGGNFTLIQEGLAQLVFNDSLGNVIVPSSVISGTPANVTVTSGGLCQGILGTGTSVITASLAGYTDGTITITCSGGRIIMDPAVGTNSVVNNDPITSWLDSNSNSFTGTGLTATIYKTSGVNGKPAIVFDGLAGNFQSPAVADYNKASWTELVCLKPTAASATATSRNIISNGNGSTSGYTMQLDTSDKNVLRVFNGSAHVTTGSTTSLNNPHYLLSKYSSGASPQIRISVDAGADTTTTGANYTANAGTFQHRIGSDNSGTGNFTQMELYLRIFINRATTTTEDAQLKLRGKTLLGL